MYASTCLFLPYNLSGNPSFEITLAISGSKLCLWTFQLKVYKGSKRQQYNFGLFYLKIYILASYCPHCKPRPHCGLWHRVGRKQIENETRQTCGANSSWLFHWRFYISLQKCFYSLASLCCAEYLAVLL